MKNWHTLAATVLGLLMAAPLTALAKYPEHPIRLIVPYAPGGAADITGRLLAKQLSQRLGQAVIVDNRAGGGTIVGATAVAKAAPDGYTLFFGGASTFSIQPHIYTNLPYTNQDFTPLGTLSEAPVVLVTSAAVKEKNLPDLVKALKRSTNPVQVATAGKYAFAHLTALMAFNSFGVPMIDVPYKGEGPAMQALVANEVQYYFAALNGAMPLIAAGKLQGLAVTTPTRANMAPNIPTFVELGFPDVQATIWFGLLGPKGMPRDVVKIISDTLSEALDSPELRDQLTSSGQQVKKMSPEALGTFMKADSDRWKRIIVEAKIEPEKI